MKILVGYDGSNAAKDALKLAITHATAFNAKVLIVSSRISGEMEEVDDVKTAEKKLEWAKALVDEAGIRNDTHLLIRGMSPGEDVVAFAKEQAVDSIIIGVQRRSKVGKILFGSNAQYIILNAHCPVTTIK
jgi:nucleotide-binding universal stress UspA family protein